MEKKQRIKKLLMGLFLILFSACSSGKPMNLESFNDVAIGTSVEDLKSQCGSPIEIKQHQGEEEYIYIERLAMGNCKVAENYYSFFIQDGKVVRKDIRTQKPPAFNLIYTEDPNNPCM
jgi:hypothetical protein